MGKYILVFLIPKKRDSPLQNIEKQTNLPASYGAPSKGTSPHKIKMADSSSDKLTITQKQRIINNGKIAKWISKGKGMLRKEIPISALIYDVEIEKETSANSQEYLDSTGSYEENENLFLSSILDRIMNVKRTMMTGGQAKISEFD